MSPSYPPRRQLLGPVAVVARRLGANASGPTFQLKRWGGEGDDFLACLARGDAGSVADVAYQRTTLRCVDDARLDLPAAFAGAPTRDERASIFGDADPYPNLAALANATRAWLAAAPD